MNNLSDLFLDAADYYNQKLLNGLSNRADNPIAQFLEEKNYKKEELLSSGLCQVRRSGESSMYSDKIELRTIKSLKIGFTGSEEQELYKFLKGKNYTEQELLSSGLFYVADGSVIKDKFWHSIIFPAIDKDGNIIGLISKKINKNFSQNSFINIANPWLYSKNSEIFCADFDGKKRGYVILCENPFYLIYYHNDYVYNSIHFFNEKIEITDELLSLIRECGNTVKLHMLSNQDGAFRAKALKETLKKENVFVL